jgi:hypothetical protein
LNDSISSRDGSSVLALPSRDGLDFRGRVGGEFSSRDGFGTTRNKGFVCNAVPALRPVTVFCFRPVTDGLSVPAVRPVTDSRFPSRDGFDFPSGFEAGRIGASVQAPSRDGFDFPSLGAVP